MARVRAQIGHVVSQAGAVDVTAHQGRVILSGSIAAHEVEKLLSAVASVAGVDCSGQSPGSQPYYSVRRRRAEQQCHDRRR